MASNQPPVTGQNQPPQPPPPQQPDNPPLEVNLAVADGGGLSSLDQLTERLIEPFNVRKEKTARAIGIGLVFIFGFTCFLVAWKGFAVIYWSMDKPENTEILVTKAVIPFLEKLGTFLTTVFGPLLAFILGYYFGQQQTEPKKTS